MNRHVLLSAVAIGRTFRENALQSTCLPAIEEIAMDYGRSKVRKELCRTPKTYSQPAESRVSRASLRTSRLKDSLQYRRLRRVLEVSCSSELTSVKKRTVSKHERLFWILCLASLAIPEADVPRFLETHCSVTSTSNPTRGEGSSYDEVQKRDETVA